MLVSDVITQSLQDIGVIDAQETPDSSASAFCLARLNRLDDQWAAENLMIPWRLRTTWTLNTSIPNVYTLGSGGDINIVRPVFIDAINYIDSSTSVPQELQLTPLTVDAYEGIVLKSLTSPYPASFYYNPTFTNARGSLTLYPATTLSTLTGVLYSPVAIPRFPAITNTFSLPPGYERMIATNLALEIAPGFEKAQINPALIQAAQESKSVVMRSNQIIRDMGFDAGLLGNPRLTAYNIYTS